MATRQRASYIDRNKPRQIASLIGRQADRQIDRYTERQVDRQVGRQAGRQTHRNIDRKLKDIQTDTREWWVKIDEVWQHMWGEGQYLLEQQQKNDLM